MSEPIRTITFQAGREGVTPDLPQFAGVQGEHNATEVVFQMEPEAQGGLASAAYQYRVEFRDGAGGFDTTDVLPLEDNAVRCLLPQAWTAAGGEAAIRLCAALPAADGQDDPAEVPAEQQIVYTLEGRLRFAPRRSGDPMEHVYQAGLTALIGQTAACAAAACSGAGAANTAATAAQGAADEAENAADAAQTAATAAGTAASAAQTAADGADAAADAAQSVAQQVQQKLDNGEFVGPQGVSGVYVGGGEMPAGYNVQIDPAGTLRCYTADETDSLFAGVLTGKAAGAPACAQDVSPRGCLWRAAAQGATTLTGTGEKGPDNPYTLAGAQPTALHLSAQAEGSGLSRRVIVAGSSEEDALSQKAIPLAAEEQTVPLPALPPLYGDENARDEYDAATGVLTRRWGRIALTGEEAWETVAAATGAYFRLAGSFGPADGLVCTHFAAGDVTAETGDNLIFCDAAQLAVRCSRYATAQAFGAFLAAQAAAGTPVTAVYRLAQATAEPAGSPVRVAPFAPVCCVSAGESPVEIGYNRDLNEVIRRLEAGA